MTQFLELQTDAPVVVARLATGYVLDTLREGDDLKLVCDVQSNPPPMLVIWYHDVSRNRKKEGKRRERVSLFGMIYCYSRVLIRRINDWSTMWTPEFCWLQTRWLFGSSRSFTSASIPVRPRTPWEKLTARRFLFTWNVSNRFYLSARHSKIIPVRMFSRLEH